MNKARKKILSLCMALTLFLGLSLGMPIQANAVTPALTVNGVDVLTNPGDAVYYNSATDTLTLTDFDNRANPQGGIYATGASAGTLTIVYSGSCYIKSRNSANEDGIHIINGQNMELKPSNASATLHAEGSSAPGNSNNGTGIAVYPGSLTIDGGNVTAVGGTGTHTNQYGIYTDGTLKITGGAYVAASSDSPNKEAIYANIYQQDGGTVVAGGNARVGNSAIITGDSLQFLSGGFSVSSPTNGVANGDQPLTMQEVTANSPNANVTGLSISGATYYGFVGMRTDADSKVYLWLPAGANVNSIQAAPTVVTVTYNANYGTNAPTDNTNYAPNDIVTVAAAGSMTGPGGTQTFIGWSKTAPVSGDIITPGSTFNIASDTTLYAVWSGNGSAAHPFVVSDAAGLNAVRNDLTKRYILTADINAGSAWVPIGYGGSADTETANQFTGSFDGNGHAINIGGFAANITPGFFGNEWLGLFGVVGTGGTVQNLKS